MKPAYISLQSVRAELRFCSDHFGVTPRPQSQHWPLSFAQSTPAVVPPVDLEGLKALQSLFKKATAIHITPDGAQFFGLRLNDAGREFFKGVA